MAGWCYICVRCESGLSVYMAGPGICVLCLADTCTYEVHPEFNLVSPYGYLLSDMYLLCVCRYHNSKHVCLKLSDLD